MVRRVLRIQPFVLLAALAILSTRIENRSESAEQQRNAYVVKSAFRDAVADATRSTVRVLCDDRRTALGVVVDSEGYILTKASELSGEVTCQVFGRETMPARDRRSGRSVGSGLAESRCQGFGAHTVERRPTSGRRQLVGDARTGCPADCHRRGKCRT
jgi:hypothetical protein